MALFLTRQVTKYVAIVCALGVGKIGIPPSKLGASESYYNVLRVCKPCDEFLNTHKHVFERKNTWASLLP
jgi:hypothetical protein